MAYLIEVPVTVDGGAGAAPADVVRVEVERGSEGLVDVARPGQVVARATRSLGDLLAGVRPVAQNFVEGFRGMAQAPDEISLEFGLSFSAEADVVITSSAAQANFTVSLTWQRPPAPVPPGAALAAVPAPAAVPEPEAGPDGAGPGGAAAPSPAA